MSRPSNYAAQLSIRFSLRLNHIWWQRFTLFRKYKHRNYTEFYLRQSQTTVLHWWQFKLW